MGNRQQYIICLSDPNIALLHSRGPGLTSRGALAPAQSTLTLKTLGHAEIIRTLNLQYGVSSMRQSRYQAAFGGKRHCCLYAAVVLQLKLFDVLLRTAT